MLRLASLFDFAATRHADHLLLLTDASLSSSHITNNPAIELSIQLMAKEEWKEKRWRQQPESNPLGCEDQVVDRIQPQ